MKPVGNESIPKAGAETTVFNETPIQEEINTIATKSKKNLNTILEKIHEVYKGFTHIKSESNNDTK